MSRVDELIAEYCPNGVQIKLLGEVVNNFDRQRKPVTRSNRQSGPYPYYGANGIQDYVHDYIFEGTFLLVGEDGSVKNSDGTPVLNWAEGQIWVNNHAHILQSASNDVLLRYIYYALQRIDISQYVTGGTQPKLNQKNMNSIPVPVPPLEVQRAIVEILDTFSKLEAELEAELEARKQQYEHYRSDLLASAEENLIVPLHQVAKYSDTRIEASNLDSLTFVGVDNLIADKRGKSEANYLPNTSRLTAYEPGDVLIGNIRPYLKKVWLADSHGGCSGDVLAVRISEDARERLDQAYLYFQLSSDSFFAYNMQHAKGAKMPRGNKQAILNYPIAIPPLEEQRRIVSILDKFDALVNDLSVGLPAELAARRQQYEHYRDKLLTFKELEVTP